MHLMGNERVRLALRRAGQLAEHSARGFFAHRGTQLAAAISYYALFAIFPLAILGVAALGVVLGEDAARRDVLDFLQRSLPVTEDSGRRDLERLVGGVTRNTEAFGIVGVLGLAFAASGLMGSLRNGLNTVWEVAERRPPLQGKALDLLLVVGVGALLGLSLAGSVATQIARSLTDDLSQRLGDVAGVLPTLADLATSALPLGIGLLAFVLLFRVVPSTAVRWREALLGALVATGGYALLRFGFGLYLDHIADYGAVYGSLGAVIAFVFFVFLTANAFILGAEAAARWPAVRRGEHDTPPGEGDGTPWWRDVLNALRGLAVRDRREPER